ncbi:hypothetical protein SAMN04490248_11041 [Salinihabitans flavidus]|uniref:Uncharacterized protein n=1 Tax=Salinihabitans flavidus TaxID=569882 RepID=A0A1H8RXR3_9RHOB|nr:hypothetical protein [Salinihabitans flavidus]SEO71449.1 hypothetical protein SAMN04490248_11041 [Salinihabitans flavidus]
MKKLIAIVNVVAWSGFWAFGYLALTAERLSRGQLTVAAVLAFAGFITGIFAYLKLVRAAEASGYARKSTQLDAAERNRAQSQGGL